MAVQAAIHLRPFRDEDHYAYQGVEGAAEIGRDLLPLNGMLLECEIVVDDNGINLMYYNPTDDASGECYHDFAFQMDEAGVTQAKAVLALLNLAEPSITIETLQALGFIYNKI